MGVKINIHPSLYQQANNKRLISEVDGETVGQCLEQLIKHFPGIEKVIFSKNGELLNYVDIYVNGASAYPEELAKTVKDGDELYVLATIAGG